MIVVDRRGTGVSDPTRPTIFPRWRTSSTISMRCLPRWGPSARPCSASLTREHYARCSRQPARSASGLILYATAARGRQAPDYPWQWSEQEWQDYLDEVRAGWGTREYAQKSLPFFNPSLAGDERMLAWWERFMRLSASPNSIYAQEQVFRDMDIRSLLPAIGVPSLVLHRTEDAIEPVGAGRYLAGEIADAEYVELPGRDHFPGPGNRSLSSTRSTLPSRVRNEDGDVFDRVLATVLFTDIVDSTAQAAAMGDRRWRELREHHVASPVVSSPASAGVR